MDRLTPCAFIAAANAALRTLSHYTWKHDGTQFVHHVGVSSHLDCATGKSCWPLPKVSNCDELARVAHENSILSVQRPYSGELFLLFSRQLRRFVKAGIVAWRTGGGSFKKTGIAYYDCLTIESRPHATGAYQISRKLSPECGDRFVGWADLDGHAAWGHAYDRQTQEQERCVVRIRAADTARVPAAVVPVQVPLERAA
jgi:hypothetical protein